MKSLFTLALAFTFTLISFSAFAEDQKPVGLVAVALHDVFVSRENSDEQLRAQEGSPVYLGDTFLTKNEESFIKIEFNDKTHITMNGEDASLTIDKYIYDAQKAENNKATFGILKGSFEFVGGLIDKSEKENVQINLDFGSIGIRGTKVLRSMKDGECWIYLEDGKIRVFNDGGFVNLNPGDGTRMSAKNIAPRAVEPWSQKNIDWIKRVTKLPE